jgi:hypothetical protein
MRKPAKTVTRRGQSEPPNDLAQLIALVNAEWPFKRELPDVYPISDSYTDTEYLHPAIKEPKDFLSRDAWVKICEEAVSTLSRKTRAFLGAPANLQVFFEKYALLKSARQVLLGIPNWYRAGLRTHAPELMIRAAGFPGAEMPFQVSVSLILNEQGQFKRSNAAILDALIGVRADRIRLCVICNRIFWAPRANSECCGKTCRKNYNQRNSRANRLFRKRKRR